MRMPEVGMYVRWIANDSPLFDKVNGNRVLDMRVYPSAGCNLVLEGVEGSWVFLWKGGNFELLDKVPDSFVELFI